MASVPMAAGKAKLEKAYLSIMAPSSPGTGGLLAGLGGAAGGALGVGSGMGAGAGAMGDSMLGTGGQAGSGSLGQLTCMFNPTEYSVQKSANWQRTPLPGVPQVTVPQFTGSGPKSLSLELFLDAADSPSADVAADVELLFSCCTPTPQSRSMRQSSPPFVLFGWGSTMSFTAVVKSVNAKFTRFRPDGTPTQATVQVSLEEVPMPAPPTNPTSGAVATHRSHLVTAGDTLPSIAYREYRNPNLWRAIADANGIDDPMRLPSGTRLLIPPAADAAGLA